MNQPTGSRRTLAGLIAHYVVHRQKSIAVAALIVVLLCAWILRTKQNFDSEVLNLLPPQFESVQALKKLNSDFTQARELIIALQGDPQVIADFEDHFAEALSAESWVQRVFLDSPMATPEGIDTLQTLVPALLLNLDEDAFADAMNRLAPEAEAKRLHRIRAQIEAGSPKAEMELAADPLGLLGPAMRPLSSIYGIEKGQSSTATDGTLRVIPVVTNQVSLSQPDCKALMAQVEQFKQRVLSSWDGPAPEILVTGRSAYVAQISASMERDVTVTSTISILAVSGLFYLGFRRIMPLIGITVILALSCFVAFAVGCLAFENLNMIAIAFCSILVGLGDDFSLLLYNRYLEARGTHESHEQAIATSVGEVGKGIFYVSLTTGVGFLVLLFSGSAGFAQLGMLVAIGIVLCAVFMIGLLFLFIRPQYADERPDPFRMVIESYLRATVKRPAAIAIPVSILCLATVLFAVLPLRPLRFDTSPRSLEPKNSPAAIALKTITTKIPAATEPIAIIVESSDAQQAHERWASVTTRLEKLVSDGELKSFSSPAALMLSPLRIRRNQETLRAVDLDGSRLAFERSLEAEGFNPESFQPAFALYDRLKAARDADLEHLDFRNALPAKSSWWFLIDRYFSAEPHVAAAFLQPSHPLTTPEDQEHLEKEIKECGVPLKVTGWTYAMISLVPWAKHELTLFTSGVGGLILVLLGIAYRSWRHWLIHTISLLFAIAATVTTLKVAGIQLNMLNALAFPLVLGVGVDYGMHVLLAARESHGDNSHVVMVLKPLVICGLTTITGFGSLIFARNPALSGLGLVCALGVFWCLVSAVLFIPPVTFWSARKRE